MQAVSCTAVPVETVPAIQPVPVQRLPDGRERTIPQIDWLEQAVRWFEEANWDQNYSRKQFSSDAGSWQYDFFVGPADADDPHVLELVIAATPEFGHAPSQFMHGDETICVSTREIVDVHVKAMQFELTSPENSPLVFCRLPGASTRVVFADSAKDTFENYQRRLTARMRQIMPRSEIESLCDDPRW